MTRRALGLSNAAFDFSPGRESSYDRAMDAPEPETYCATEFGAKAREFAVQFLQQEGEATGEQITAACVSAGHVPLDTRAFGPSVIQKLLRDNRIQRVGDANRKRGHGARGGSIYRLVI